MGEDGQKVSLGEVAAAWLSTREPTMFSCTSMDVPLIWRWLPKNLRTAPSTSQSHSREKVHGSLARAGKVRGQTPKVEAQEKKKKKTGRAKRRIQYNRRFVNVVATFG